MPVSEAAPEVASAAESTGESAPLHGKTALVTGGSRGIGRAVAERLGRDGALVAVHYGSDDQSAKETVDRIEGGGGKAFTVGARLGEPGDVDRRACANTARRALTSWSTTPGSACPRRSRRWDRPSSTTCSR